MRIDLPFEIGDDFWWVDEEEMEVCCEKGGIHGVAVFDGKIYLMDSCGQRAELHSDAACLTREEAEAFLEKIKKEKGI